MVNYDDGDDDDCNANARLFSHLIVPSVSRPPQRRTSSPTNSLTLMMMGGLWWWWGLWLWSSSWRDGRCDSRRLPSQLPASSLRGWPRCCKPSRLRKWKCYKKTQNRHFLFQTFFLFQLTSLFTRKSWLSPPVRKYCPGCLQTYRRWYLWWWWWWWEGNCCLMVMIMTMLQWYASSNWRSWVELSRVPRSVGRGTRLGWTSIAYTMYIIYIHMHMHKYTYAYA